jgi:hypothetical protein
MSSDADLPPYHYNTLKSPDHVRVLALQPASNFQAPLKTSIIQYDRKTMYNGHVPLYEAVSYTWVEPFFSHAIIVDDVSCINITETVDAMLRHYRKPLKALYL